MRIAVRFPFTSENSANPFTSSKPVFTEICNLVRGSNIRWRGRSFAASVPSDAPKVKKCRKRVPKDERQAMVETFVNRYRAMNSGKFPTASDAKKEVGGSYYVIRKIVQELEYKSKISSSNTTDEMVPTNDVDTRVSSCKHFEMMDGRQTSILVEKTLSEEVAKPTPTTTGENPEYVATQSHMLQGQTKEILHPCPAKPEDNIKEKTPSEDMQDFDGPKPKAEQQQLPELEKFVRDSSKEGTDDEDLNKKASMWGNLKSLADGIINIWRKL